MRIYDPPKFGAHVKALRMKAGVPVNKVAEAMGMDQRMYEALEEGLLGSDIKDELLFDCLVEEVPGLSIALAPGVYPPSISKEQLRGED